MTNFILDKDVNYNQNSLDPILVLGVVLIVEDKNFSTESLVISEKLQKTLGYSGGISCRHTKKKVYLATFLGVTKIFDISETLVSNISSDKVNIEVLNKLHFIKNIKEGIQDFSYLNVCPITWCYVMAEVAYNGILFRIIFAEQITDLVLGLFKQVI